MTFDDILAQVIEQLQREGRVSYRALKRRFALDNEYLEDLKAEIIAAKRLAIDEDGKVLVWTGQLATTQASVRERRWTPLSYTPRHLADKILTTRSALHGERKQVTVLFADVAGFSTLAERLEPEDVHTLMDGCFDILTQQVHAYEGTINQFTGDGIMALFGAPIAHEDHAVRALHAALGIQAAMQAYSHTVQQRWGMPFQMRLGLNTGTVVVGRIGDDLRMDYTAQGDTVNLAARMQQMAPPGAIWVAEATYRAAGATFEWQVLAPMTVKGKATPVAVYALRRGREVRSRFEAVVRRGLTQFTGRDSELERLLAAWRQAQQGQGQVVSVIGEAGLGKSRLVYEFKERLASEGAPYVEGTCFTYGDTISYLPFLGMVRALCGVAESDAESVATLQINTHLATLELEPSAVAPYLHNLLSLTIEDAVFPKLPADLIRQRTVAALTMLITAEAQQRPLALILEDVHWIDKATEEVVGALVEAMVALPLLLVLAYRPEYEHAWAGRAYHAQITLSGLRRGGGVALVRAILTKSYASRVPLEPLSPAQRTAMAQHILGKATLPPEVEQLIVTKTDGNPLFIEELLRALLESGALVQTPEGYALTTPVERLDLPTTVQGVLLARIDRLHDDLKEVLQVAAVMGRVFSYPLLAQVVRQGAMLEQLLVELEDLELIYPTSLAPQREYSFKHVLTQEAVYGTLLRPQRERYHEWIGEGLEALYPERLEEYYDVLAYHYVRSGNKDKAVEYLDLANQKAARASAMAEAKGYFDAAMALLDTLPETEGNQRRRIALLGNQGQVMLMLLKMQEYYDLLVRYRDMAVGLDNPGFVGAFYMSLGWGAFWFGHFDEAIETLTKGAELCEAAGNMDGAGQAYVALQWSYFFTGDYTQVLALQERALRTLAHRFHLRYYVWALTAASWAYAFLGRWEDAVREGHEALRLGEEYADSSMIAFADHILSVVYTAKNDLGQALEYGELAVQKGTTPADNAWAQAILAWVWCRRGELRRGVETLAQAVSMHRAASNGGFELLSTLWLGEGYWLAGEHAQATQTLRKLLEGAQRCGTQFLVGSAHRLLGEIALCTTPAEAAPHFEQSIATLHAIHAENELALAYAGYGRWHAQQGDMAQARDYLTRALAIFERLGTLGEPDRVRQALAALPAR
jgi:class 3 adenylate cyclase/tetratricopeptide (TPR) repeat protein